MTIWDGGAIKTVDQLAASAVKSNTSFCRWVVLVFTAPAGPRLTVPEVTGNGGLQFTILNGVAGQTAVVELSIDLVHWLPVSTNVFPATMCPVCPTILFKDSVAVSPKRFYRVTER